MSKILRYTSWLNEQKNRGQLVEVSNGDGDLPAIDWKGKLTGAFFNTADEFGAGPIFGIGIKKGKPDSIVMMLGAAAKRGLKWGAYTPPTSTQPTTAPAKPTPPTITPSVDFKGTDFPYPDNIITPDWSKFPSAKAAFDELVKGLIDYFTLDVNKAKTAFQGIEIEGAADVAPATNDIPSGYTALDHNYGGGSPSNEFLATNRAVKMKEAIVAAITGKLAAETVTFISGKIKTVGKTGLPRGQRYVKITTTATPYEVITPSKVEPGKETPGTQTPGQTGPSGEISKQYSVLRDPLFSYFFPKSSSVKIDSSAVAPFRPDKNGQSDFQKIKLTDLQLWAKEALGGELLSAIEVAGLTAEVEPQENQTAYKLKITGVPAGKVIAPVSTEANNEINTVNFSKPNSQKLKQAGHMMDQVGALAGWPFILYYSPLGDGIYAILEMKSITILPENVTTGQPY
jgi:hypothetical protein